MWCVFLNNTGAENRCCIPLNHMCFFWVLQERPTGRRPELPACLPVAASRVISRWKARAELRYNVEVKYFLADLYLASDNTHFS